MAKKSIQYGVVDAFTAEPFKGNPAAVCLLEDAAKAADERWLQAVAAEFNLSETAFLLRDSSDDCAAPRFQLRWFTPVAEVELCGHATLASAHFLFTTVLAEHDTVVEFATKSGILTAKKVPVPESAGVSAVHRAGLPMIDLFECDNAELPSIPNTLNGASIVSVHKSATAGDLIVELSQESKLPISFLTSMKSKSVPAEELLLQDQHLPDLDPVTGSAHCVLAPYWGGKLGKQNMTAFQASARSGILYLKLEAAARRVRIQGEAVTVMTGTLLA
ncbi:hypothetical protein EJB05_49310 [Eragrostis curvula]|uniref:Phenazine biosynthesis protein n=1 Tax=Eragrostis curvula TaxID=38414 RepID=A0A5J9T4G1_9POAL|nr:hypothetical protein EJB05_49310 [Eragrostis curvula]